MPVNSLEGTGIPSWISSAAFDLLPFLWVGSSAPGERSRVERSIDEIDGNERVG